MTFLTQIFKCCNFFTWFLAVLVFMGRIDTLEAYFVTTVILLICYVFLILYYVVEESNYMKYHPKSIRMTLLELGLFFGVIGYGFISEQHIAFIIMMIIQLFCSLVSDILLKGIEE